MTTRFCWEMGLEVAYLALALSPPLSAQEPKLRTTLRTSTGSGTALAFSSNNKLMVTGGKDGVVRVWDVETNKEKAACKGHKDQVYSVAFSPDGKLFASASEDKTVKLVNVDTGKVTRTLHHMVSAYSVAFSPDGKMIASGDWAGTVKLWDVDNGKERAELAGHNSLVCIAFSPNGKLLAAGSDDESRTCLAGSQENGSRQ